MLSYNQKTRWTKSNVSDELSRSSSEAGKSEVDNNKVDTNKGEVGRNEADRSEVVGGDATPTAEVGMRDANATIKTF